MKIYKFGGASLKNQNSLEDIYNIVKNEKNLILVVSAIDKTTNALEMLVNAAFDNKQEKFQLFEKIKNFHLNYVNNVFENLKNATTIISQKESLKQLLEIRFNYLFDNINNCNTDDYDMFYDSIVPIGEFLSSTIVNAFLFAKGLNSCFIDITNCIRTDSCFRDAKILFEDSEVAVQQEFSDRKKIYITQGFIGQEKGGFYTTLGREGSDYTAAALGYMLDAESVTVWKDVPGIMNADPAIFDFAKKIDKLSFKETIELAFYGAKVIHPKTIKPLENKNIPLYVKSFAEPELEGSKIDNSEFPKGSLPPIFILTTGQLLISIQTKDFSFIVEENMSRILAEFAKYKIKINIMQNSAISFSLSINDNSYNIDKLMEELKTDFVIKYNYNVNLLTIRNYNETVIENMLWDKKILMEQRSRTTARFIYE